jgi:hypothetical protein
MARIEGEIMINRPVEEVFDFVADVRNEPRYNPRMVRAEMLTPEPVGLGSRFRAEMRTRPRRLASTSRWSTMEVRGGLTFDPVPGGTRMRWSWDVAPRGLLKLMSPLVVPVGARQERAIWTGLKRLLEAKEVPTSAGG